jgi:hypothetical protein
VSDASGCRWMLMSRLAHKTLYSVHHLANLLA